MHLSLTSRRLLLYHSPDEPQSRVASQCRPAGDRERAHLTVLASRSAADTIEIGRRIGRSLVPGSVIGLEGPLGAGKTTLVKGIAQALGVAETVTSPTFTLISEYRAVMDGRPLPLYHIDLYRIGHPLELEDLGLDEILAGPGVAVIEWSEKAGALLPEDSVRVVIALGADGRRRLEVTGVSL